MVLIAAGQLSSTSSLTRNGAIAVRLIDQAAKKYRASVLFLPEASDYIAASMQHSKKLAVPVETSPFVLAIQSKLRELFSQGIHIEVNVGVHEPSPRDDRVMNTSLWFASSGAITHRYQKIHLFDVSIPGASIRESEGVEPGSSYVEPFATPCGKVGLGICYDLRFPELALRLRSKGAEVLSFPSAFTLKTGAAHWKLLGQARALDTQSYVVMAAQTGGHVTLTDEDIAAGKEPEPAKRFSYGHTLIVDPWGTVVAEVSDIDVQKEALCVADIDLELVEKVRKTMPLWEQRRPDVFGYDV